MKRLPWILAAIACGVTANGLAQTQGVAPPPTDHLKDPIELCVKLGGTERAICERQAREGPRGATGTAKPDDEKRGNTPPGASRSGDAPLSGAIVDPAGVTKR